MRSRDMKYSTSKKMGFEKKVYAKSFPVIMRCVNCNCVGDGEDIAYGCARCIAYPKDVKTHTEGGWYKQESSVQ